mgnify:CR=1 FL=1
MRSFTTITGSGPRPTAACSEPERKTVAKSKADRYGIGMKKFCRAHEEKLARALAEEDIVVYVHPDKLRAGFHFYNTDEHGLRLIRVLKRVFG